MDLVKERFDLAIRGGPLADSTLIARRLSSASLWLYAAARYRHDRLEDIPFVAAPHDEAWLRRAKIAVGPAQVIVDDRTAIASALEWGAGIGLLPAFLGQPLCETGALFRPAASPVVSMPIHALFHESQRDDVRLQVLMEEIERQLALIL